MLTKQLLLSICALFTFTTFIMVIVAIAGSTSNYKPITNVYIGTADVSHINVTKVIPQVGPILTILGTALTAPNSSLDEIFGALKAVADTPALTPLLTLLSNAENTSSTVIALTDLAPLAVSSNSTSSTQQLVQINELLELSTNRTDTLEGLSTLVLASMDSSNSSSSDSSTAVLNLLLDSNNVTGSTDALMVLNNMTLTQKAQLLPVFELFQLSTNDSATFSALAVLMNTTIPTSTADTLFKTLEQTSSANLNQTLAQLSAIIPSDLKPALTAVSTLVLDSTSPNTTVTTLQGLMDNNVTQSPSAQTAFSSLTTLVTNANNDTLVLDTVESLATITNTTSSTQQLVSLQELLGSTSNGTQTLTILGELQAGLVADPTTAKYIPSLFSLLLASKDASETFSSLVTLTAWAQQNPTTFTPIIEILQSAVGIETISDGKLKELTPYIMDYLNINTLYQLSIFTLCEANTTGEIKSCSSSHAVQNLDFRSIIWNDLSSSDFDPYLKALNVTEQDLQLQGKLLNREHQYVPAIKATLALSILSIVFAFITCIVMFYLIFAGRSLTNKWWFSIIFLTLCYALFTCLSAVIVTAIIGIIKSGTYDDNYGVVFKSGSAYMGLIWTSFVLSILCPPLVLCAWLCVRRENKRKALVDNEIVTKDAAHTDESLTTSSNEPNVTHEGDVEKVPITSISTVE